MPQVYNQQSVRRQRKQNPMHQDKHIPGSELAQEQYHHCQTTH